MQYQESVASLNLRILDLLAMSFNFFELKIKRLKILRKCQKFLRLNPHELTALYFENIMMQSVVQQQ